MRILWTIALTAGVAALSLPLRAQPPGGIQPPRPVTVAAITERTIAGEQTFVGTIMPLRQSTIGSAVEGRVLEFFVNEGDFVERGKPLAQVRTKSLEIEIAGAKAELAFRQQELEELETGTRPEEIEQARARMLSAKAQMTYAQAKLKRTRDLFERRISSDDQLDDALAAAEKAIQAHAEAKIAHDLAVAGPRKEKIAQSAARVQVQEEEIARLEDRLDKHTIVAPFDGYVIAEHTEEGEWIKQGDPVTDMVDLSRVDVELPVLENYLSHLEVGMAARVEVAALPDELLTGTVALIVPQADLRSRSFPIKVRLENRVAGGTAKLKPGMFARVVLPVGKKETALLAPKDAVVLGGPAPMVYVIDPTKGGRGVGKARSVNVTLGVAVENLIQVHGDLQIGDLVVVAGNERLRPGQEVAFTEQQAPPGSSTRPSRPATGDAGPLPPKPSRTKSKRVATGRQAAKVVAGEGQVQDP